MAAWAAGADATSPAAPPALESLSAVSDALAAEKRKLEAASVPPAAAAPPPAEPAAAGGGRRPAGAEARDEPDGGVMEPFARAVLGGPLVVAVLRFLEAEAAAQAQRVCSAWQAAGRDEWLWRRLSRLACRVNDDKTVWKQVRVPSAFFPGAGFASDWPHEGHRFRAPIRSARAGLPQALANARRKHSWRAVFPTLPRVRSNGCYRLRASYIRTAYRDMWHNPGPMLQCVFHRVFQFRPDGSLLYTLVPGELDTVVGQFA